MGDYKFTKNANNELVLNYQDIPVASMSPDGSWFNKSISTGVGSLHLGGNESGGVAHSMSSSGQNVGFKNEFSKSLPDEKLFFFPTWQAVSCDGKTRLSPTFKTYGPWVDRNQVNGTPHASSNVLYNFNFNATADFEVYAVTVISSENYVGKLNNIIISNTTGAEIYNTAVEVTAITGSEIRINYKYPFSVRGGDNLKLKLVKQDGNPLLVRAGTTISTQPWRALSMAVTFDNVIATSSGYTPNRILISNSNGDIAVSALQNDRAVISNASGIPIAATTTATEIDNIRGGKTRDTTITLEDGDGFVVNDSGNMTQASAGRVWEYIKNKLNGAVSTALSSNLTANAIVFTNASGKLATSSSIAGNRLMVTDANGSPSGATAITASRALTSDSSGIPSASTTTSSELNNISGTVVRNTTVTLEDGDGVVVNDNGTMIQAAMSRVWAYIQAKLTGAVSGILTSNLTANQVLVSGSDGKITTRNLGPSRMVVTDSNGLPTGHLTLVANRIMMTNSEGLPSTVSGVGPIYYKNSISAAGTYTVVDAFNGGFVVNFVRTSSTIYLQVTHTQLGSRYQYQTTVNGGSPSSFWTSSSGNNYPANLPAIATNGGSISGWFYGTDGSGQSTSIRVDFSIITNGMTNAICYACVS